MKLCIVGSGHVGLVTGVCFADLGNRVICVDSDKKKIELLRRGKAPFFEPGLEEMIRKNSSSGRLSFTTSIAEGVRDADVTFISVSTPSKPSGETDLSYVEEVTIEIARSLRRSYHLIVDKSTVPVETGERIYETIHDLNRRGVKFEVASNPEFLREGCAVHDFLEPDRIVIGVASKRAEKILRELYKPIDAPLIVTDIKSSEVIKHASNSFLATKISFINMVSRLCDHVGADVTKVAEGMGMDGRIGKHFLQAGVGFGGSCFPKDLAGFIHIARKNSIDFKILRAVTEVNEEQKDWFIKKVEDALWNLNRKVVCVLGLAFKPDTDDMRSAPSVDIIERLINEGVKVQAYDPQATHEARKVLKTGAVKFAKDAYEAVRGADAILLLTEWNEFKELDFKRVKRLMRKAVIVDGRNLYDPGEMKALGFKYISMGRG
ncbi:MAG: UDP-glucose/GDP-mannose dehydrogenase family protein [Candidatus Omnitrophica bacterium]|nr:UDP-glucose/GDP-mannose dehydrogenase family protein [Candidatus Omnitrophota bacterium]